MWAACTVAFYGGLRSSEYLVTGPKRGLRRSDVQITPEICTVRLGIQETKQHGSPSWLSGPATSTATCPVRSWHNIPPPGTPFSAATAPCICPSGRLSTHQAPSKHHAASGARTWLQQSQSPHRDGHLGVRGCEAGADDNVVRRLGRWSSEAYNGYVRSQRPAISQALLLVASRTQLRAASTVFAAPAPGRQPTSQPIFYH